MQKFKKNSKKIKIATICFAFRTICTFFHNKALIGVPYNSILQFAKFAVGMICPAQKMGLFLQVFVLKLPIFQKKCSFFNFFCSFFKKNLVDRKIRFIFATSNLPSTPMQKSKCGKKSEIRKVQIFADAF